MEFMPCLCLSVIGYVNHGDYFLLLSAGALLFLRDIQTAKKNKVIPLNVSQMRFVKT